MQRLSAAMALIGDPKLVIFDEPTTALDVTTQIEVLRAFKSVMRTGGIAGVYVSHDLAVVAQIADRIVVLKGGEIQETGTDRAHPLGAQPPLHARAARCLRPEAPRHGRRGRDARHAAGARGRRTSSPATAPSGRTACRPRSPSAIVSLHARARPQSRRDRRIRLRKVDARARHRGHPARRVPADIVFDGKRDWPPTPRGRSKDQLRELQIVFQFADTALNPAKPVGDILGRPLAFYHGMTGQRRATPASTNCSTWSTCPPPAPPPAGRALRRPEAARQPRPRARRRTEAHPLRRDHLGARHRGRRGRDRASQGAAARARPLLHFHQPRSLDRARRSATRSMVMYNGEKVEQLCPPTACRRRDPSLFEAALLLGAEARPGLARQPRTRTPQTAYARASRTAAGDWPQSGNRLVSGICALTIGDFSTTKLKYLSMPISMSVSRSMIV